MSARNEQTKEHLLALKVMRLTKPSFSLNAPVLGESRDIVEDALEAHNLNSVKGCPWLAVGEMLILPQNFGNIFLGETFASYICVHNDSDQVCRDVIIKADLQTGSQRVPLTGSSSEPILTLPPDQSFDEVIQHEVKEMGTHILVCSVSYMNPAGEKFYFRKFFKFQVLKPLDVKTKFFNAESDHVFLEAQIQNMTTTPIVMERVVMEPSANYRVSEMNALGGRENESKELYLDGGEPVHGRVNCLKPLEVRQYLYCLSTRPEAGPISSGAVGKLDISWRSQMGERGRLQTCPLSRLPTLRALRRHDSEFKEIRVQLEDVPREVPVETPFMVNCKICNSSDRNMDLVLSFTNVAHAGVMWMGTSGRQLGSLAPGESLQLRQELVPLAPGLQTINGIKLLDTFLKKPYSYDNLAQVLVTR